MNNTALFFCALIFFGTITNATATTLTIAYEDKEQPPYYMGNSTKVLPNKPGVAVEMIQMLASIIDGLEIKLKRYPWKRCLINLKDNKVDGAFNASYKEKRLEFGWYPTTDNKLRGPVDVSRRVTNISYSLYVPKDTEVKWDGKNITNVKKAIGAPMGYSIVADLKKKGLKVDEAASSTINLKKLAGNRLDAIALQDVTADNIIKSNPAQFKNIIKLQPPLVTKPYYFMLSDKFVTSNPELAQKIWDTIKLIRETKFDEIASKYSDE